MVESSDQASTDALMHTAAAHHRRGLLDEADSLYRRILETDPDHARVLMLKGVLERERDNLGASLELLRRSERAAADDVEIAGQLAISYMAANDLVRADQTLRRALAIDPKAPQALANLGALLQHRGLLGEAMDIHRRYLALEPNDIEVHCNLANSLADAGDGPGALVHIDTLLERIPNEPMLLATRGAVLCSMERFVDACEALDAALSQNAADDMALINLALARRRLGETALAIEALQAAIRFNPDNARAMADLANLYLTDGHADVACDLCEKFLLHHPGERLVLGTYPYALRAAGRVRAADGLLDYARLIAVADIDAPAEFANMQELNRTLSRSIGSHPTLMNDPVSKSTRGGAQTGELDVGKMPGLTSLAGEINQRIVEFVGRCERTGLSDHPAMIGAAQRWSLRVWATVLNGGGHQSPHIHPLAWLSGVYYVALPADMTAQERRAGWLEFGRPPDRIGVSGVQHEIEPREGRLILFPSYFYHCTRLFTSSEPRISIAFDVMPMPAQVKDY